MVRKGGGPLGDAVRVGMWGTAYANSDGTLASTVKNRYTYSFYIIIGLIVFIAIWFLFGHKTFNPTPITTKEPFENKEVKNRPMFQHRI
jgi:hypothetical protein